MPGINVHTLNECLWENIYMDSLDEFAKDAEVMADMVKIWKPAEYRGENGDGGEPVGHALRRRHEHCIAFAEEAREDDANHGARGRLGRLMVSNRKTEAMRMLLKGTEDCPLPVSAGGQAYKQTDRFEHLGRTICASVQTGT